MTPSNEDIHASLGLFEKDFKLDESYFALSHELIISYDQAHVMMRTVIEDLMAKDFTGLLNVLYRIDVSEQQLKKALVEDNDNPASIITQMIFDRQLQKVKTRKKYS